MQSEAILAIVIIVLIIVAIIIVVVYRYATRTKTTTPTDTPFVPPPFVDPCTTAPGPVTNVSSSQNGPNSITLKWSPSLGATSYIIQGGTQTLTVIPNVATIANLIPGNTYGFTIIAQNKCGQASAVFAPSVTLCVTAPSAPTLTYGGGTLSWPLVADANYYDYYAINGDVIQDVQGRITCVGSCSISTTATTGATLVVNGVGTCGIGESATVTI
jgi:hypothetical protein